MADAAQDADGAEQCLAVTESGDRCSRPARENGFCHQHDESDETVDDRDDEQPSNGETANQPSDGAAETMATETDDDTTDDGSDSPAGIKQVRDEVRDVAGELIGREFDGVILVEQNEDGDGWRSEVEVIERAAVPNTQDILGRYELSLDENAAVTRYGRLDRYRRDDTSDRGE